MNDDDVKKLLDRLQCISQELVDYAMADVVTKAINCIHDQRKAMDRAVELLDNPSKTLPWEGSARDVLVAATSRHDADKRTR